MSRKKVKVQHAIFECSPYSNNKTFVRFFLDQIQSPAFISLTPKQRLLYFYMKLQFCQKNSTKPEGKPEQFYFNRALYKDRFHLYSNDAQFRRDRDALIQHGFITCRENGAITRSKSIYAFSDEWQRYGTKDFHLSAKDKTLSLLHLENQEHLKH